MTSSEHPLTRSFLSDIWSCLDGDAADLSRVTVTGDRALHSAFAVTDLAAASFAAAGLALSRLVSTCGGPLPAVRVDRTLSSGWFDLPVGPSLPLTPQPRAPEHREPVDDRVQDGRRSLAQGAGAVSPAPGTHRGRP
ncbi:hypothetical protein [Nonomuraea sp. NPDC002799]